MSIPLIECIPNFSEGRRPEVVEAIVNAIRSAEGVVILDHSLDHDHNRSVVTFVGTPEGVFEGAFAGIAKAAELIDLDQHQGEHPRLGATDVVPFVPISDVSMADCIELAQKLGKRVSEELQIPVYLYEKAATDPSRENLAILRKGEYEGLKEEIEADKSRKPDFGPAKLPKAGATVIGARDPLVAYNVYLNTDDVEIAKAIGKAVRHLSGGLRYVKGLGMLIEGKAQVSMNLTNFKKTPVFRAVELIRREAARYGTSITRSELIGLIPQQALIEAAVWYLQLDGFSNDQILETRMQNAQADQNAIKPIETDFLDNLAAGTATPGGGSAAAYSGSMAAGLVAMVARLTVNKKKYKDVEAKMWPIIEQADQLREDLAAAVETDSAAYQDVMAAFKLPKKSDEEKAVRKQIIQKATIFATKVPLNVVKMSVEVLALADQVVSQGNLNAITDGGTAAALAGAAISSAGMNVQINLTDIEDQNLVTSYTEQLALYMKRASELKESVRIHLKDRGGLGD